MQSVEEGTRNITEEFDDSEIGLLGQKFKEMVNNNLVLRERLLYAKIRQREQSQIRHNVTQAKRFSVLLKTVHLRHLISQVSAQQYM